MQRHILPALGRVGIRRLRYQQIEALYDTLLHPTAGKGLAPKSVYEIHLIIKGALADALRRGLITRNVAVVARAPKQRSLQRTEGVSLTDEELRQLIRAAVGHRLFPLYWLTAMTGMRRNEVLGLMWPDIDFTKRRLHLNRGLVAVGYEVHQTRGKTRNARRTIHLDDTTLTILAGWQAFQRAELATAVAATVRDAPAIAFGDVVGANVTICLVALGVGALIAPIAFTASVLRYEMLAAPLGALAVAFAWDGRVARLEGAVLAAGYLAYVAAIWVAERQPPSLGEVGEIAEAKERDPARSSRVGKELAVVLAGLAAMVIGAALLVDGIRDLVETEANQARASLTIVGFATGFELVVLAWSAARRGISEAVVAGVVGSYAYNVTMTLGVAAVVKPLRVSDASLLQPSMLAMLACLGIVLALATRHRELRRVDGRVLLGLYPAFVVLATVG